MLFPAPSPVRANSVIFWLRVKASAARFEGSGKREWVSGSIRCRGHNLSSPTAGAMLRHSNLICGGKVDRGVGC